MPNNIIWGLGVCAVCAVGGVARASLFMLCYVNKYSHLHDVRELIRPHLPPLTLTPRICRLDGIGRPRPTHTMYPEVCALLGLA